MLPSTLDWIIIVELVLGLAGIVVGFFIAHLAPEELFPGRKYFFAGKMILLVLLIAIILTDFFIGKSFLLLVILSVISLGIIIFNIILRKYLTEIINYLFFVINYFLITEKFRILFASLLFIYGLFSGTFIYDEIKKHNSLKHGKKEKKRR